MSARSGGSGGTGAIWWGVGAAGLAGVAMVADRVQKVRRVPAELRSMLAYLPITFNASTLHLLRAGLARTPSGTLPGVSTRGQTIRGADAPDVRVLISERPDRPAGSPVLLWIHGGGYVIGNAAMTTATCRRFARDLNALVVSVDYRLAPENPFPAGLDDCYTALTWLHANAATLGIDPARIAVGGESAGGGLAASLAQRAHDESVGVAFQLLIYPMLDDRTCQREPTAGVGELIWTPASNHFGWSSYLGAEPGTASPPPYAAASRRYALAELPPAWIGVGTPDLFHGEDVAYAERLRAEGVDVTLEVVEGLYHGADGMAPEAPQSKLFYASQVDALRHGLGLA
jgi:acetyl esterase/lipase